MRRTATKLLIVPIAMLMALTLSGLAFAMPTAEITTDGSDDATVSADVETTDVTGQDGEQTDEDDDADVDDADTADHDGDDADVEHQGDDADGEHQGSNDGQAGDSGSHDGVKPSWEGDIPVTKVADDDAIPETGQHVTFTFTIHNGTDLKFWIDSIEDDVFGTLAGDADCMVGTQLDAGASCSFTHTAWLQGQAPGEHVNTVTVTADHFGAVKTGTATETVVFAEVAATGGGEGGTGGGTGGGASVLGAGGSTGGDQVASNGGTAFTGGEIGLVAAGAAVLLIAGLTALVLSKRRAA